MAAEHSGAMAVGGETREARPVLGRRSKLERDLKEGEAELRARAIGEWRGGAGEEPARAGLGRGEAGWNGAGAGRAACAAEPKARRRPTKEKNSFSFIFSRTF